MSLFKIVSVLATATLVAGHGYISGINANGKHYDGYIVTKYPYMRNPPDSIGWSTTAKDLGFVDGSGYQTPDIICHRDAKPGKLTAEVTAGSDVELEWTPWPDSHHGPVITYFAPCNGDCANVDKSALKFSKIDAKGLIDDSNPPGTWASDNLISDNNTWTVTIPKDIADGNYVLRNEIIALHSAENKDGVQNYPQCLNVKVTGGGNVRPAGTAGEQLCKDTDPGVLVNIYTPIDQYVIPGPPMYNT